jgi:hypothetical protein
LSVSPPAGTMPGVEPPTCGPSRSVWAGGAVHRTRRASPVAHSGRPSRKKPGPDDGQDGYRHDEAGQDVPAKSGRVTGPQEPGGDDVKTYAVSDIEPTAMTGPPAVRADSASPGVHRSRRTSPGRSTSRSTAAALDEHRAIFMKPLGLLTTCGFPTKPGYAFKIAGVHFRGPV